MIAKKIKPLSPEQDRRHQAFLDVFRHFDTVGEAAEWIAQATCSSIVTVMTWRSKNRGTIPVPKWALLEPKFKKKFRKELDR